MKKKRALLFAGIIGFAFMASSCSRSEGMMMRRMRVVEEVTHIEDNLNIDK